MTFIRGDTLTGDIISHLNENAPEGAGIVFHPVGENVIELLQLTGKLREDLRRLPADSTGDADFLVLIHRRGMFTEEIMSIIERNEPEFGNGWGDVPFTEVYRLKNR